MFLTKKKQKFISIYFNVVSILSCVSFFFSLLLKLGKIQLVNQQQSGQVFRRK